MIRLGTNCHLMADRKQPNMVAEYTWLSGPENNREPELVLFREYPTRTGEDNELGLEPKESLNMNCVLVYVIQIQIKIIQKTKKGSTFKKNLFTSIK